MYSLTDIEKTERLIKQMAQLKQRIDGLENILSNNNDVLTLEEAALYLGISRSSLYLDRTNRIFYKIIMQNEQRSKDYHVIDSLIHSNSFFKTYRTLDD